MSDPMLSAFAKGLPLLKPRRGVSSNHLEAHGATTFAATGAVQNYTVPQTGYYTLQQTCGSVGRANGGVGAVVSGAIYLNSGTNLAIVVGSQGGTVANWVRHREVEGVVSSTLTATRH